MSDSLAINVTLGNEIDPTQILEEPSLYLLTKERDKKILDIFYHFYNNNPKTANNYLKLVLTSLGYNNFQVFHHWTSKELSGNTLTWVILTLAIDICVRAYQKLRLFL